MKIAVALSGMILAAVSGAAAVAVAACSSSSSGSSALEAVCGNDPSGTTCTCTWQAPTNGAAQNSCTQGDPRGACCQDDDWKQEAGSKCTCIPPDDVNCFYSGSQSLCECLVSPTPPSTDFLTIAECDAPFPGHCCQTLADAGTQHVCECSVKACTKQQVEIANCGASMSNASCGNNATQVDTCK